MNEVSMSELLEEMGEFFNTRSSHYNEKHLEHVGGIESKHIIASFLPDNTKTLIDLGIGTGLELEAIFKRFPDIEITGFDIAKEMLNILKETYPGKNITLHCENYLSYDLGVEIYDVALSVLTLHHYSHEIKTDLYRKIHRCIKKDGIYIERDYILTEPDPKKAQEMEDFYFSEYERLKTEQGLTDDKEYHYDTPCTVSNQIKMLLAAGFTNVREVLRRENAAILIAEK